MSSNFIFERDRVGSYLAGYAPPEGFTLAQAVAASACFTLAQAVAASACFPPLFGPLRIDRAALRFKGGRAKGVSADERKQILEDLRVTDGGVYDNMGLEPVWKSHRVVPPRKSGASSGINRFRTRKREPCASASSFRAIRKARSTVSFRQACMKRGSQPAYGHEQEDGSWHDRVGRRRKDE